MGSDQTNTAHRVVLSKSFYMGIFEVTQKQWTLVTGTDPCSNSSYGKGNSYPVHYVSYNMIRGATNGANWPSVSDVDATSFLGKLQARTSLSFDLPTGAQWEYACRAGTTSDYYWGSALIWDYCWYSVNPSTEAHAVGKKRPNAWGLYDMNGNVWEWCLDWYGSLSYGTDPRGSSSGTERVVTGGSWGTSSDGCTSSSRGSNDPAVDTHESYRRIGLRLSLTGSSYIAN